MEVTNMPAVKKTTKIFGNNFQIILLLISLFMNLIGINKEKMNAVF